MLKLATLIQNPGEPAVDSRYQDPEQLKALGYTGVVLYETVGLSGVMGPDDTHDPELQRWLTELQDAVGRSIHKATQAGLDVYLAYDLLVLPTDVAMQNPRAYTCDSKPGVICPAQSKVHERSTAALQHGLKRWPEVAGVVVRFGDNDAERMPHLTGNDIYLPRCTRCKNLDVVSRIAKAVEPVHKAVVEDLGKRLIVRAWNVNPGGMHDDPTLAQRIARALPGDPKDDRLVLSFKCSQTDFWRYQPWNAASLRCGDRPILYELQCQREFEGKGGIVNWQAPLWRDGQAERADMSVVNGLAEASDHVNFAGLWAWVRGGGWGGPFVTDETWIDANAHAVPRLADNPKADPQDLAKAWITERLGFTEGDLTQLMLDVLNASSEMIRKAFYIEAYANQRANPWHPAADWIRDDLLDASAASRMIERIPEPLLYTVVQEKQEAVDLVAHFRHRLQMQATGRSHVRLQPMLNSMIYAESLFEALRDLLGGLVGHREHHQDPSSDTARDIKRCLLSSQSHWNHHTQRHGSLSGAPTAFREKDFWEKTQDILSQVM